MLQGSKAGSTKEKIILHRVTLLSSKKSINKITIKNSHILSFFCSRAEPDNKNTGNYPKTFHLPNNARMSVYESCVEEFGATLTTELLQCVSDSTEAVSELSGFGNSN